MSSEDEDFRQQIVELRDRVARLEARLGEPYSGVPAPAAPAAVEPIPGARKAPAPLLGGNPPPMPSAGPVFSAASSQLDASGRSLESRIGSQLFNRIGIIAVLIGVAWFLKLAIDNGWIGPAARVFIGLLAGGGLVALAERFRTTGYRAFSYSLQAIATGVLYLSVWAAFSLFHLIPGGVALVAMVLVTGMNALMCWLQNSEVLAFYATIGGFITPILLSVHAGSELALLSYLLLLDVAVVALIAMRPWSRLLVAAFAGTTFYAVGWYATDYAEERFGLTLFFILAFFLLFAISPQLLRSLRLSTASTAQRIEDSLALRFLPALNAALAFIEMFFLMSDTGHIHLRRWIALPFAAFYLLMLRVDRLEVFEGSPAALPPIYLVISVVFATIAIPMEAHGRWVAIGWFLEFAALVWLGARRSIRPFRLMALGVLFLGVAALILQLDFFNPPVAGVLVLNTRFATWLVAIAACAVSIRISLDAASADSSPDDPMSWRKLAGISAITATVLLLIAVCLEIHAYWAPGGKAPASLVDAVAEQFSYSAWLMLFGAVLLAAGFWRKSAFLRWQALVLLALSISKVFLFDTRQLSQGYRILSFLGLGALLLTVSFAYQKDWLGLRKQKES